MSSKKNQGFGFSGFQLPAKPKRANNAIPPPPSSGVSKQGYSTMTAISQNALAATWGMPRKRAKTEEEYFDEDDEDAAMSSTPTLAYIPAPGSPTRSDTKRIVTPTVTLAAGPPPPPPPPPRAPAAVLPPVVSVAGPADSDEEDPLDAFMAGIEQQVQTENSAPPSAAPGGIRDDIECEDNEESYYRYMEENPNAGLQDEGSDQEIEYDEDGNPIAPILKKIIDPLPPIDHSLITYEPYERNFYTVHEEISALSKDKVAELRAALGIKVTGPAPPQPITSFGHLAFDDALLKAIIKSEYTQPTPIQAQAVPAALSGRDLIGIAKTGSGKTAAFIWPLLVHIMDQRELQPGDGPIGLILAPTRELSQQIYNEARKFGKVYNIQVVCAYGGGSKWEQSKALEAGAEIVVATPGRIIDLVKIKATNLQRVTFLVLDEADRMFDMGFEPQVRSICNHVRPDRQTLLFSATFKKKVERLARDVLTDPVRIIQGELGEANMDVTQIVLMMCTPNDKFSWLIRCLVEFLSAGSVLIFVTKKADAEQVANSLTVKEFQVLLLHGDMDQTERNKVITQFKRKEVSVLVATDVAARGLDIPHIRTVVNYDIARDIDTHTHRIGRTGRAGEKGTAYTLVTERDKEFAGHLVRNLEGANQEVPSYLLELAMQSSWFRKSRFKGGKGKSMNVGGCGLGFKERPRRAGSAPGGVGGVSAPDVAQHIGATLAKSGPATDRLSAMKAAFKSQYQTQFTASSDSSWQNAMIPAEPAASTAEPTPPGATRRVKKSRWE